ncbi:hypothetical protein QBC33DRAFT_31227 [Phialemonium atrogriseum]|uniref:DUF6546 domain-containing protein n=1 Tax=Phialemonium atrogriseum TaxID=1093897 RepID=A0AAJ0C9X3_9PEZI|nr:uncharacterized protein QBC33DRAFT_31227 [Phialemonium atrogriseum]KAK1772839.1 hypothetical protein QBC33DRAFT_31227 [Phialemonium atrogriseum]
MASTLLWPSLPMEIRLMILELLPQEHRALASYASVCNEWAEFIEKKNFGRLKLGASSLNNLEHMVSRQRSLVRHIWLNIELRPYTCRSCQWMESESWMSSNNTIISRAISKLFTILSTWNPAGDGLALELSAQSPSDTEHYFKNFYFGTDDEDKDILFDPKNHLQEFIHDPKHGWVDGQQVAAPCHVSLRRLYEEVRLTSREELPVLHVVTKLVLRRQFRRRLNIRALRLLLDKLPRLECIVYEPWQVWGRMQQRYYDKEYKTMIDAHLPKGLKRLSIFEDYNDDFITVLQGTIDQTDPIRIAEPTVGAAFAYRSLDLQQLSVSFMVDAWHFFQARQPLWTWGQLQSLVLTSRLLTQAEDRWKVSNLLEDAGAAALQMPKLHTMALWNGGKGQACAFIYRRDFGKTSIVWRGTWEMNLEPRVIRAWERVVSTLEYTTSYSLRVESQPLCPGIIGSHGDAIHQLDLPIGVVDPTSLWQIRREGLTGWGRSGP